MAFERGEQALFESFFKIFFTQFLPLLLYTFFQKQTFVKTCIPTQTQFAAKPLEIQPWFLLWSDIDLPNALDPSFLKSVRNLTRYEFFPETQKTYPFTFLAIKRELIKLQQAQDVR